MDYTYTGVNQASALLAPIHAMQFGNTFRRVLQRIAYANPSHGPVLLAKIDLSDGYYRVPLSPQAALELAVVLPPLENHPPLVGIPLMLPMGWKLSPPYFCAFTETATDIANAALHAHTPVPPQHALEAASQLHAAPIITPNLPVTPAPDAIHQGKAPIAYTDVYMDDFIGISQPNTAAHTMRALLWGIHQVFRGTPHPADTPARKQVISASKLAAGDGQWSTQKPILGWLVDTAARTIHLLPHKAQRLHELLSTYLPLKRTSRTKWLRLLGELRHMATAIPGARYLFSLLQNVLVDQPKAARVRLSPLVIASLHDWLHLATTSATNPTPIRTLVPAPPDYLGAVDASGAGIGGFFIDLHKPSHPGLVFRAQFPPSIADQLVTASNPAGKLTNSDFELVAIVAGAAILSQSTCLQHSHLWCGSDNTPAVAWCRKGSTSSKTPAAFLLRWLASLTRASPFVLCPVSIPGNTNTLADFCSRSFHLPDQVFLQQLHQRFPTPAGWQLVHPTQQTVFAMTSALSCVMSPWVNPTPELTQPTPLGQSGPPSVHLSTWTPSPSTSRTESPCYRSLPTDTDTASYLPAALKYAAERWATPFVPLGRRSPTWDTLIRA